jgi:hypothetical protein
MPAQAKQPQVMSDGELVATILTDPSLRKGDIVMFPDGARVYRGSGRFSSHRASDFEVPGESEISGTVLSGPNHPSGGTFAQAEGSN